MRQNLHVFVGVLGREPVPLSLTPVPLLPPLPNDVELPSASREVGVPYRTLDPKPLSLSPTVGLGALLIAPLPLLISR